MKKFLLSFLTLLLLGSSLAWAQSTVTVSGYYTVEGSELPLNVQLYIGSSEYNAQSVELSATGVRTYFSVDVAGMCDYSSIYFALGASGYAITYEASRSTEWFLVDDHGGEVDRLETTRINEISISREITIKKRGGGGTITISGGINVRGDASTLSGTKLMVGNSGDPSSMQEINLSSTYYEATLKAGTVLFALGSTSDFLSGSTNGLSEDWAFSSEGQKVNPLSVEADGNQYLSLEIVPKVGVTVSGIITTSVTDGPFASGQTLTMSNATQTYTCTSYDFDFSSYPPKDKYTFVGVKPGTYKIQGKFTVSGKLVVVDEEITVGETDITKNLVAVEDNTLCQVRIKPWGPGTHPVYGGSISEYFMEAAVTITAPDGTTETANSGSGCESGCGGSGEAATFLMKKDTKYQIVISAEGYKTVTVEDYTFSDCPGGWVRFQMQQGSDDDEPTAVLIGKVINGTTNEVFGGYSDVFVKLANEEYGVEETTEVGYDLSFGDKLDGDYTGYKFESVALGLEYVLTYSKEGYVPKTQTFTPTEEKEYILPAITLELAPEEFVFYGTISYSREFNGVKSGSILLGQAQVAAYADQERTQKLGETTSGEDGGWVLTLNVLRGTKVYFEVVHPSIESGPITTTAEYTNVSGSMVKKDILVSFNAKEKQPAMLGLAGYSLQQAGTKRAPQVKVSWTWPQALINNYRQSVEEGTYSIEKVTVRRKINDNAFAQVGEVVPANYFTVPATSFLDNNGLTAENMGNTLTYQLEITYMFPDSAQTIEGDPNLTITLKPENAIPDTFNIEVSAHQATWGTVTGGGRYVEGKTASLSATAYDGFVFVGWNENGAQVSGANPYEFTVEDDRTLTAVFKYDTVELTLEQNDLTMGTVTGAGKYRKNQQVTATATANDGYKFVGWNENGAQVSTDATYTFTITANRTLTAVFKYDTVTLTLQRNDNNMGTVTGGGKYRKNYQATAKATANDGYVFVGWNENGSQVSTANPYEFTITGNRTLMAVFKHDTVTLTLERNNDEMGTVTGAGRYRKNQQVTATATAYDGYKFVNWKEGNTQASAANPYTFKITGNRTLTAVFKYDTVTLTLQRNNTDMGTVTGGGKYRKNHSVKITATPEENHVFVAWKEGETVVSTENPYTFNITSNRTIKAFFQPDSVTLNLSVGTLGRGTVEGAAKYQKGEEVSISAIADYAAGFVFDVWKNGNEVFSHEADTTFVITESLNLAAYFKHDSVDLVLSPNDSRMGTVTGAGSYRRGQSVEIKAIPNTGYRWKEWRENDTVVRRAASATHTFTIQRNRNLVAVFVPDSVTLNLEVNNSDMGSVTGGGRYKRGTTARVKATPNPNYVFVKWVEQDTTVIASATGLAAGAEFTTRQLYNDRTFTAIFKRDSAVLTVKPNNAELGSVTGGGKFAKGQSVTVTATANGDNEFLGWRNNDGETVNDGNSYTFTFTGPLTLTAYFKMPDPDSSMLTLTVNDADMGTASARGKVGGAKFEAGETVKITATPNTGYKFVEWQEGGAQLSTDNPYEVEIEANHDRNIEAVFAVKPDSVDLTLYANNDDWGVVEGEARYQKGESVVITATPSEDYVFVGWKDNSGLLKSTEATYRFNIESDLTLTAYFQPDSMDLALEVNEARMGTVVGAGRYGKGQVVKITATPNDGYAFVEWKNGTEQFSDEREHTFEIDENLTLKAFFKPDSVMLSLDVNDPTMGKVTGMGRYRRGTRVTIKAIADTGYKFVAWKEGETVIATSATYPTKELTADRSLKAYFEADPVELTLTVDNAAAGTVQGEGTYLRNKPVVIKAIANPGYRFVAWEEEDGTEFATEAEYHFNIKKTRTLKAVFVKQVTLTLTPDDPDRGTVDGSGTYDKDANATATATPNEGYEFVGWQENGGIVSNDAEYTFAMEADRTLTAIFAEKQVKLTLYANNDDWGSVEGEDTYGKGARATAKAIPNDGYVFVEWKEGETQVSTEAEYTFTIEADRTFTAVFAEKPVAPVKDSFNLTLQVNDTMMGKVEGMGRYEEGTQVNIKAIAKDGYVFEAWKTENGETEISKLAEYSFVLSSDSTLKAFFAAKPVDPVVKDSFELALQVNDTAMGKVEGMGRYEKGTKVTIKATAKEGYVFEAWKAGETEISKLAEYSFVLNSDSTLKAFFAVKPVDPVKDSFNLSLHCDAKMGKVEGAGRYEKGTKVTIKATAKEGYEFRAWMEGDEVVAMTAEHTLVLEADRSFTAVFAVKTANEDHEQAAWSVYVEGQTIVLQSKAVCQYDVYNLAGALVKRAKTKAGEYRIAVNNSGLYIVRRITAKGVATKKVVVR